MLVASFGSCCVLSIRLPSTSQQSRKASTTRSGCGSRPTPVSTSDNWFVSKVLLRMRAISLRVSHRAICVFCYGPMAETIHSFVNSPLKMSEDLAITQSEKRETRVAHLAWLLHKLFDGRPPEAILLGSLSMDRVCEAVAPLDAVFPGTFQTTAAPLSSCPLAHPCLQLVVYCVLISRCGRATGAQRLPGDYQRG